MSTPLAEAELLATQGRYRAAIDLLTDANRAVRDPSFEERLVDLRREACPSDVPASGGRARRHWNRDRFRHTAGIPEITSAQLQPNLVRSAILRHGSLLVRGLLPPQAVERLVGDIDRAMAAYDASTHGAEVAETAPWYVPCELPPGVEIRRDWVRDGGGVLAIDSPRALFDVIDVFEEAGVGQAVRDYLEEDPLILGLKWTLRRISVEERGDGLSDTPPEWHQDGAFMGRDIRSINVWVALSPCGVDAPSLDVVAKRFDDLAATGTDGALFDWTVGNPLVERLASGAIVRPVFEPGDALMFDHMMLHRTGIDPRMTRPRHAIEAWFGAPSGYPSDHVPLVY